MARASRRASSIPETRVSIRLDAPVSSAPPSATAVSAGATTGRRAGAGLSSGATGASGTEGFASGTLSSSSLPSPKEPEVSSTSSFFLAPAIV